MSERITLEELLDNAFEAKMLGVWTMTLGKVQAFSESTCTASVLPFPADYFAGDPAPLPVMRVPVAFPGTALGAIRYALAPGDTVLLLYSSRAIDRYQSTGDVGASQQTRHHHLSDCVAIPLVLHAPPALLAAARVTDPVIVTIDNASLGLLAPLVILMNTWIGLGNPPETFVDPSTGFPVDLGLTGTITGGSTIVKIG